MSLGNSISEPQCWMKTNWIIFPGISVGIHNVWPIFPFLWFEISWITSDLGPVSFFCDSLSFQVPLTLHFYIWHIFPFQTLNHKDKNKLDKTDFCYKYGSFKKRSVPSHLAAVCGQHDRFPVEMPNSEGTSSNLMGIEECF